MIYIKVYIGCDHNGVDTKNKILSYLKENGIDVICSKLSNHSLDDYPDFAIDVCQQVLNNNGLGILICGTGIGMSIAANKIKGIRCARVVNSDDAFMAKNHNGANVIALGSNLQLEEIEGIIDNFLMTKEVSEDRHLRRISKINDLERKSYGS